jgi:hypothetical protein
VNLSYEPKFHWHFDYQIKNIKLYINETKCI